MYQEKEMRILMNKRPFDKRCHYSIRKFAIGAASVMIGASIFGISAVQAEELASSNAQTEETTVHQAQPLDKLPDDVAAAIAKADENGGREFVKPKAESAEDKVTKDAETTRPANDDSHELVIPKGETPNKVEEGNKADNKQKSEEANPKPVESAVTAGTEVKEDSKKTSEKDQVKADTEIKPSSEKSQVLSRESNKAEVEKEKQLLSERKQDFNKDWYFKLNAQGDFSKKDVDVHDWSKLNLPHDWSIYFDFDHKSRA